MAVVDFAGFDELTEDFLARLGPRPDTHARTEVAEYTEDGEEALGWTPW